MAPQIVFVQEQARIGLTSRLHKLGLADVKVRAFADDHAAVLLARENPFGLGASIFSADEHAAGALARQLPTGFVTINDLIAPTADPRWAFGGVRESGFGTTRGAEGLRELTYPHVIAIRRSRWLPHLDETKVGDEKIISAYVKIAYGRGRLKAFGAFLRAVRKRRVAAEASSPKDGRNPTETQLRAADTAVSRR